MSRKTRRAVKSIVKKALKKVAVYSRVSTTKQNLGPNGFQKDDGSIDSQKARAANHVGYLSQKTGVLYEIVEDITDLISAKDTKRSGYRHLWTLVERGGIDAIVATELSRLNRNIADFLALFDHCQKHEVELHIIDLAFDLNTPAGRMMISMVAIFAQFEREMTASRVSANCQIRLTCNGRINGSAPILGLAAHPDPNFVGHFIANPNELQRVEQILKLYLLHGSKAKVLSEAKRLGIKGKGDKDLTPFMLDQLLFNVEWRYRGLWFANRENQGTEDLLLPESKRFKVVPLPHGQVIHDTDLLDRVQRMLDDPHRRHKRVASRDYVYLLSHLLIHADGSRYTGASAKGAAYRYYHNPEQKRRIHCQDLDSRVLETLKSHLLENQRFQALVAKTLKLLLDMETATFEFLEAIHKLPGTAQRTIVETLVKRVIIGDDGTLTIELYGVPEQTVVPEKQRGPRKRRSTDSLFNDGGAGR